MSVYVRMYMRYIMKKSVLGSKQRRFSDDSKLSCQPSIRGLWESSERLKKVGEQATWWQIKFNFD